MNADLLTPFWGSNQVPLYPTQRGQATLLSEQKPSGALTTPKGSESGFRDQAIMHLQTSAGLFWEGKRVGSMFTVEIYVSSVAGGPGYSQPTTAWKLCGTGEIVEVSLLGQFSNVALQAGDHLILPVDRNAEGELAQLLNGILGLELSHRVNLFMALRRPSLEARMDRMERLMDGLGKDVSKLEPAVVPFPHRGRPASGPGKLAMVGMVAAGLAIGAMGGGVGTWLATGGRDRIAPPEPTVERQAEVVGVTTVSTPAEEVKANMGIQNSLVLIQEAAQERPETKAIYEASFEQGSELTGKVTKDSAWGLLRLALFTLGVPVTEPATGKNTKKGWIRAGDQKWQVINEDGLRELLQNQEILTKLQSKKDLSVAMAAVFCDATDDVGILQAHDNVPIQFSKEHKDCAGLKLADAAHGLAALAETLQPPPEGG